MRPVRIQRKRSTGWRMPENTAYVGRPSMFGNYAALRAGLPRTGGSVEEYRAGRDHGIKNGWFEIWGGGTRVRILPAGDKV